MEQEKKKVLIVEDDKFLREILVKKLKDKNFVVIEADRGDSGFDTLRASEGISAVLLDLLMPGLNGFEFIEKAKANEKTKNVPIIVISNLGQQLEVDRAIKLGAVDYIIKSNANPGDIVTKLEEIIK